MQNKETRRATSTIVTANLFHNFKTVKHLWNTNTSQLEVVLQDMLKYSGFTLYYMQLWNVCIFLVLF